MAEHSVLNIYNSGQITNLDAAEQAINIFEWQKSSIPILGRRMSEDSPAGWRKNKSDILWNKTGGKIKSTEFDILTK